jgi:hypothetical protein
MIMKIGAHRRHVGNGFDPQMLKLVSGSDARAQEDRRRAVTAACEDELTRSKLDRMAAGDADQRLGPRGTKEQPVSQTVADDAQ